MAASSPFEREASQAYVALGSNIGDRESLLRQAIDRLDGQDGVRVSRISSVYETEPVGYTDQPSFLNMVIAVQSELPPVELLKTLLHEEKELGRTRDIRWGPRTIDLDLLLYDSVEMETEELVLPHPRMMERAFVLVPLHDVLDAGHPLSERVASLAAAALQDGKEGITLWNTFNWHSASAHSES
ncbi:2-amino-4-hydroxy-6-hydroxymethyldihydropteridine diphosphokinase [Paenibacillus protaetiae]|uniref:2-amino-4-hydroxy-6-hydroxymethyldihydropteridine diphosphokinase n=1 Tax=Paenibacillus protaetiae TaxID=2509456 RepID=A0A4P6EYT2_9BACL|nr:2-amino-4-hydroxy-6-hydroxymethyldihydropteridine diphosphokinase [Paenibacillus protaetiae]QAY67413.1 2-amino-4-hydroxy-6-hydroxymethyldihydropteridine diphosphokinase [Paenibacillus protaetiae]